MSAYPAEPWDLHGHAYVGTWLVPRELLPAPHSPETKPVTIFGRGIVGAAFFVYEEPSPLTYDEIMATVLVRHGWRLRVSITHIWVNSPASRDGGRELWAIPKELAVFDITPHVAYSARSTGALRLLGIRQLPWSLPAGFKIAQDRGGTVQISPVRGRMRFGLARARWSFTADGPLGFLHGRSPLVTIAIRPFHLLFGRRA